MLDHITKSSSLREVANSIPLPTTSDIKSWNKLNTPVPSGYTAADYSITLGLWGADLSDFK